MNPDTGQYNASNLHLQHRTEYFNIKKIKNKNKELELHAMLPVTTTSLI
jgi:hypothetical protein